MLVEFCRMSVLHTAFLSCLTYNISISKGIVGLHMDYGEAIEVLERTNEKFEFPVNWGVDLQSEHERYLTEKYAKKPVIVMSYPKVKIHLFMGVRFDAGPFWSILLIDAASCGIIRRSHE